MDELTGGRIASALEALLVEQRTKNKLLEETINLQREEVTHRYEHNAKMLEVFSEGTSTKNRKYWGWIEKRDAEPGYNYCFWVRREYDEATNKVLYSSADVMVYFKEVCFQQKPYFEECGLNTWHVYTEVEK